jgi:hypothetical protein
LVNVVARVGFHLHVERVIAGSTSPVAAAGVAEPASSWRPGQQAFTFFDAHDDLRIDHITRALLEVSRHDG